MFILKKRSWYFLTDWSCVPSSRNPFVRSSQSNSSKTTQQQTCQEKYLQRKTIHAESHNTKCIQMRNITNNTLQHSSMNSRCLYANGPYDLADTRVYLRKERHVWMLRSVKLPFFFNYFGNSTVQGREKKTEQGGDQAAAKSMARNLLSTVDTGDSHSKVVNSKLYSIWKCQLEYSWVWRFTETCL